MSITTQYCRVILQLSWDLVRIKYHLPELGCWQNHMLKNNLNYENIYNEFWQDGIEVYNRMIDNKPRNNNKNTPHSFKGQQHSKLLLGMLQFTHTQCNF